MGDHRLFAVGVTSGGNCFTLATTLCEALENRFLFSSNRTIPKSVAHAIKVLKANDGSDLEPKNWDSKSDQVKSAAKRKSKSYKKKNNGD